MWVLEMELRSSASTWLTELSPQLKHAIKNLLILELVTFQTVDGGQQKLHTAGDLLNRDSCAKMWSEVCPLEPSTLRGGIYNKHTK